MLLRAAGRAVYAVLTWLWVCAIGLCKKVCRSSAKTQPAKGNVSTRTRTLYVLITCRSVNIM